LDPAAFLRSTPPFDALPRPLFDAAVARLEEVSFPAGTWLTRAGTEPLAHLYVIRHGAVRLERHGQTVQVGVVPGREGLAGPGGAPLQAVAATA